MFSSSWNNYLRSRHHSTPRRFSLITAVEARAVSCDWLRGCPLSPSPEEEMAAEDKGADAMALDEKATPPEAGAVRFEIKKWNAVCM